MASQVYSRQAWRDLPRTSCRIAELFGEAVGPCSGPIHRHHVNPADPYCRTIEICERHHPTLHAVLRGLGRTEEPRRCTHTHRYDHARRECEARLNAAA